jgi:3-oxoacyl-[acyl-carrier-protein] synthase III
MVDTNDEWITTEQELKKEELKDEDKGTSHLAQSKIYC